MARAGLRRVVKTVRGKHGTHRRAYYMKAEAPKPSRGRRIAGAVAGAALGAIGGAIFGGAGGAGLGAAAAHRGVVNTATRHLTAGQGVVTGGQWGRGPDYASHSAAQAYSTGNVHAGVRRAAVLDYVRHNQRDVAAHAARSTALGGVWGAGAGAAGGAAFGAALGYAAAARLGRGGRAGGNKSGR